ncbi:phosphate signaling complex PhoU family protein [Deinococcus altitudinis]|uniref:phosphate signaling complex PhoU family protein n=1 Tax=Deinococcus altitudinis TaxID=468914 RepID=UPI003891782D
MTGEATAVDVYDVTEQNVKARFVRMLSLALEQVLLIRQTLIDGHYDGLGKATHAFEWELDLLERELEDACLGLMSSGKATRRELRFSLMIFRSLADLERVGDYGRHVGRDLEAVGSQLIGGPLSDVVPQLDLLAQMIERLSFALTERDVTAAHEVMQIDYEDVDALYEQIQRAALNRILERPGDLEAGLKAIQMARSLERLGDHLVNVAERVEAYLQMT